MALGERLHRWWDRVRGRDTEPASAARTRHPAGDKPPAPARAVGSKDAGGEHPLSVKGASDAAPARKSYQGVPGFDPYSSDGGYSKPHGWDDVSRK